MKTITLPLDEFLNWATGHGETPIPSSWAPIITALTCNGPECGYHVQIKSFDNTPMPAPVLWRYADWYTSQQNDERKKAYSQKQRDLMFIFDANVKQAGPYIQKFFGVSKEIANIIATKYVRDNNEAMLKALGVEKMITNIKDV